MADPKKISELTTAGPLTGVELVPIVQNSGTLQTTVSAIGIFATSAVSNNLAAVSARLDVVSAAVSVNAAQIAVVSALTSVNAAAITSVNAVVSTKAFRNGDFLTNVQYIDFNTTTSYAPQPGRLTWDIESGTLDLGLTGTVNLLIGQRTVAQVFNNSGVTLPKGKAVRVTGAQGQRLTGALAQADSDADSLTIFGIMLETVSVNRSGYVATDGLIRNVNTLGYSDGDIVYLSPVSAGELTPIKPVAPQHLVQMGYIVNGGSGGAGEIYVKVQNGYELGELHDVKTSSSTSLADGEVLAYNVSAKVWTNSTALINAQASISALQIQLNAVSAAVSANAASITSTNNVVSALEIRVSAASAAAVSLGAALTSTNNVVSALEIRVSAVSAAAVANAAAITSTNNVVSALEIRVSAASAAGVANAAAIVSTNNVVSALEIRVSTVSAAVSALDVRVAAVSASVSVLNVQMLAVQASISAINSALAAIDASALAALEPRVSALEIRVAAVSASVSVLQIQVNNVSAALTSTNNVVSALEIRVSAASATGAANSAAITSINNVVSALEIRVSAASATGIANSAAITSINNVVSALEIRVSAASATGVTNAAAITSINNVVSALEIRVSTVSAAVSVNTVAINAVSAAVSLRVLRAGDTMTGQLAIAVSADQIGVSVSGGLVVTSTVNFTGSSGLLVHSGTTATRPGSPTPGTIRFNSGSNTFEGYTSATWGAIGGGGGATGGGTNQAFYLNDTVVSVSYSIPSGKNAGTFGPITVASGVTVEVPSGSTWTVV